MRVLDKHIMRWAVLFFLTMANILMLFSKNDSTNRKSLRQEVLKQIGFPIHGSDLMGSIWKDWQKSICIKKEFLESQAVKKANGWNFSVGSTKAWYADDFTKTIIERYLVPSTCRAVGKNCYVFVEDASWNNGFVTQAEVDSIVVYFDSKTPADPNKGILEMDTTAFGAPPDVDGDSRIIILLLNIKDGYGKGGGFIVGYFHPLDQYPGSFRSNGAEIFFIDTNPLNLRETWGLNLGISTLAHELQHMIHYNYDKEEITFVNECFSTLAEVICGFPIYDQSYYTSNTNQDLFYWHERDFSLLPMDYARAARFGVYLHDQFGKEVCKYIIRSTKSGIEGINEGLKNFGTSLRFNDVIINWYIANIINDRTVDSAYGYLYPHLPKVESKVFFIPDVNRTRDTVKSYGVKYLSFKGGSHLRTNFNAISGLPVVKAIEVSPLLKKVVDVQIGSEFYEPDFDSIYYEIHFAVINISSDNMILSYSSSGYGGYEAYTLSYAESEYYTIVLPSSNKKFAVRFTPNYSGELYSVSFKLNWGKSIKGDGLLKITVHSNETGSISGVPGTQIGDSVVVPFRELVSGYWNEVVVRSKKIQVKKGEDFHIVLEVQGNDGDTLQFLLDRGMKYDNRTSSFREGLDGLKWYNRADPNYGGVPHKLPSYENLLLRSTIIYPADTLKNIPLVFTLEQNYPNPVSGFTYINFEINKPVFVSLKLYDILGREITTLVSGYKALGKHQVRFDTKYLTSGIYFYVLNADGRTTARKMVIIR